MAESIDKIEEESTFYKWLKGASLDKHYRRLSENGITEICHLEDVKEDDAESLGLTKFEHRRLARLYADFKAQSEQCSHGKSASSKAAFKTSSSSVVLSLPKVMKDFVQTRDGQGHVVVRTESLKRQFKNLYCESPVTPTQVFSNSFILQMAGERMKYSSSLRDCELWCRKERSKRTNLLLGTAKSPTIDSWTPYYQNQSPYGILKIARSRYPDIAALEENGVQPVKSQYAHLCKFFERCQDSLALANKNEANCQQEIEQTLKGTTIREGISSI